jgi:hypothetical protein
MFATARHEYEHARNETKQHRFHGMLTRRYVRNTKAIVHTVERQWRCEIYRVDATVGSEGAGIQNTYTVVNRSYAGLQVDPHLANFPVPS